MQRGEERREEHSETGGKTPREHFAHFSFPLIFQISNVKTKHKNFPSEIVRLLNCIYEMNGTHIVDSSGHRRFIQNMSRVHVYSLL